MDWEPWLENGYVRPTDYGGRSMSLTQVKHAWRRVIDARAAFLRNDWEGTDQQVHDAFIEGVHALLLRVELEPAQEYDFEMAQRVCRDVFDERLMDGIFERARILHNILPLEPLLPEPQLRLVRRSVSASSEFVATVEGYCYL